MPLRVSLFLPVFLLLSNVMNAQEDYRFDFGAGVAVSGYVGDANNSWLFACPGFGANLNFGYLATPRWAFRTQASVANIHGDTKNMVDFYPMIENFRFSTTCWQMAENAEFNFFAFGVGPAYRKMKRLTPYLTAGLGLAGWNAGGHTTVAPTLPLGIGLKFKAAPRVNLALEFSMTKIFSDRLDNPALDDPTGIKSSFIKNTDWISRIAVSLSWEFSKRCAACNYKD